MGKVRTRVARPIRWGTVAVGVAASLLCALAACSTSVTPGTPTPAPTAAPVTTQRSERLSEGEQKFIATGCAACHGPHGEGGIGPRTSGTTTSLADLQLLVRSGVMDGVRYDEEELSDQDVANIYLWLQTDPAGEIPTP